MYLAIKDHKPKDARGLYKTRPIVAANTSYNVGMSETVSIILESIYAGMEERAGVISTDDMLARINLLAEGVREEGGTFVKRGAPWAEAYGRGKCFITATDVEALFPSLNAKASGRVCMEMIRRSNITPQNMDLEEALLYLMVNEQEYLDKEDLDEFREHLPIRKTLTGEGPTMKNEFIKNGKQWSQNKSNSRYPWHHMATLRDTPEVRRKILGLVVNVAIQVMFGNFAYTFGGEVYQQEMGVQ